MIASYKVLLTSALVAVMIRPVLSQEGMTARDVFWSSTDLVTIAPNPAAHKHAPAHPAPPPSAKQNVTAASGGSAPTQPTQSSANPLIQRVSDSGYGTPPHFVAQAQGRLGLRCSVMLRDPDGSWQEVPPDHVFHSGDKMRFGLLGNQSGFFYVIQQGSSGEWKPIYPRPSNQNDVNRIEAGNLQSTRTLEFDQTPGDERVFIIFSRTEIADIDKAIEALKVGDPGTPPPSGANSPVMEAKNTIPDAFVQRLSSRDLKLVDEQAVNESGSEKQGGERAVYVVAKTTATNQSNQEVVLKLTLHHE